MELITINVGSWRLFVIQLGLVVLGSFSTVILLSFGGQLIVAPGLLPAQWLVARATDGWVSRIFGILGGLLLLEVVVLGAVLLWGESNPMWIAGCLVAVCGATAFYRTSQNSR